MRRLIIILALLAAVAAVAGATASADGVSAAQLTNAGWTCIVPLPGDNVHCVRPGGLAAVLSGEAETMSFLVFRASNGEFLGTEHIIRADLFHGEPCPTDPPSGQYTYLPDKGLPLNYFACHRYDSSF